MKMQDVIYTLQAHSDCPKSPSKAVRKWDGKTPYYIHPLWCATMIATETNLDEKTRGEGIQVLLYHDFLEDTAALLPSYLPDRIIELVRHMTFENTAQEMQLIWDKPAEIRLYKLYDKTSNLLDSSWMDNEKLLAYSHYTDQLCLDAERNYGKLNITTIAKAVIESTWKQIIRDAIEKD